MPLSVHKREKKKVVLQDLTPKILLIKNLFEKPGEKIIFAYLFGSQARGEAGPLSDIDIAVYFEEDCDLMEAKLNLVGKLMDLLGTDHVDLVILNKAPLPLTARIIRDSLLLVDRDTFFRQRYESLMQRKYFDFSLLEKSILNRRFSLGR